MSKKKLTGENRPSVVETERKMGGAAVMSGMLARSAQGRTQKNKR